MEPPLSTIEEVQADDTPPVKAEPPAKKARSEAQVLALQRAREKAVIARKEAAEIRAKEREVERVRTAREHADRVAKVRAEFDDIVGASEADSEADPVEKAPKRRKKPARRVIHVTEASSGSEEEVEVKLPRARKSPHEVLLERTMEKMFSLG